MAAVEDATGHAGVDRDIKVGIVQYQVGIVGAQLQYRLFQMLGGFGGHFSTSAVAAGQGDATHGFVGNHRVGDIVRNHQRAEDVFRQARFAVDFLQQQPATRNVLCVF